MRERRKPSPAYKFSITGLLLLVGVFLAPELSQAAFSEPGTTPLNGTPPTFLNGSTVTQRKLGSLLIGPNNGTAQLCLNADPSLSIHQPVVPATCIDSWSDIVVPGSYVRRQQYITPSDPQKVDDYIPSDRGFATVVARTSATCGSNGTTACNQGLSTVVKVNTASTAPVKYAVYATDGGSTARSAVQLSGKTLITNGSSTAELCLNGQCITRWSEAFSFGNLGAIRLQNMPTLRPDVGHASVGGVIQFTRSLTIGRPTGSTLTAWTSDDGQCTDENGETDSSGSDDCP